MKKLLLFLLIAQSALLMARESTMDSTRVGRGNQYAELPYRQQPLRITARSNNVTMNLVVHMDTDKPVNVYFDAYNSSDELLCRYLLSTPGDMPDGDQEKRGFIIGDTTDLPYNPILDWLTLEEGEHLMSLNKGSYVLVYGENPNGIGTGTFTRERHLTMNFQSGLVDISGNVMSLLYGDDPDVLDTAKYIPSPVCFARLFNHNNSNGGSDAIIPDLTAGPVDASNLILPADTLTEACYDRMFNSCNLLTAMPELPATVGGKYSYLQMFGGCVGLKEGTVVSMQEGLSNSSWHMFHECSGLETAPDLLAVAPSAGMFSGMFTGCTSLNKVRVQFAEWNDACSGWLPNVPEVGTFICPSALEQLVGESNIPEGWVVELDDNIHTDLPIHQFTNLPIQQSSKFLHNGRVLIERNGICYDVHGARVK